MKHPAIAKAAAAAPTLDDLVAQRTAVERELMALAVERESLTASFPNLLRQGSGNDLVAQQEKRMSEQTQRAVALQRRLSLFDEFIAAEKIAEQQRQAAARVQEWERLGGAAVKSSQALQAALVSCAQLVQQLIRNDDQFARFQGSGAIRDVRASLRNRVAMALYALTDLELMRPREAIFDAHQLRERGDHDIAKFVSDYVAVTLRQARTEEST